MTDLEWQEQDLIRALQLVDDVRHRHTPHAGYCGLVDSLVMVSQVIGCALAEIRYDIEEQSPIRRYEPKVAR